MPSTLTPPPAGSPLRIPPPPPRHPIPSPPPLPDLPLPTPTSTTPRPAPLFPPTHRRPSPTHSPFPSLRLLLHPRPGLGVDIRAPLTRRLRCYLQLQSYFGGASHVIFGVHMPYLPCLRLQLTPEARLSFLLPLRLFGRNVLHTGAALSLYDAQGGLFPAHRALSARTWRDLRRAVGPFLGTTVEMWHHNALSSGLDGKQKAALRELWRATMAQRAMRTLPGERAGLPELVQIDPRDRSDPVKRMREKVQSDYKTRGMNVGGRVLDMKEAIKLFEKEGMTPRIVDQLPPKEVAEQGVEKKGSRERFARWFPWFKTP